MGNSVNVFVAKAKIGEVRQLSGSSALEMTSSSDKDAAKDIRENVEHECDDEKKELKDPKVTLKEKQNKESNIEERKIEEQEDKKTKTETESAERENNKETVHREMDYISEERGPWRLQPKERRETFPISLGRVTYAVLTLKYGIFPLYNITCLRGAINCVTS